MRKLFLLIAIIFSVNVWAQKEYSISDKFPYAWAPLSAGEVNIHSTFTNNATNANDTAFWIEFLDKSIPSAWGMTMCTNLQCYTVNGSLKEPFYTSKGQITDLKSTHSFGSPAISGIGNTRYIVYREGFKNLADTITFNSKGPATGVKTAPKTVEASISPNPVKNDLIITLNDMNVSSVSIINLVGKEVMQLDIKSGKTFDVSSLPNGIYFLNIKKGDASYNKKFVISR